MSGGVATSSNGRTSGLRVLGPVTIEVDGTPVAFGGPLPRRLLAALVLHRNTVVSSDLLMDVLWADGVPETGLATLQSYVSRLRRALPPPIELIGQQPGYRLVVAPNDTDVDRFESHLAAGMASCDANPATARERFDRALSEWRGDAFAEFRDESWAKAEAIRLSELRLVALEARLAALLAVGHNEAAAGDALAVTVDHPWRERPWITLLLALHRTGRQAEAMRAAHEYRLRLRDELGLEPSAEFVALEREVAAGEVRASGLALHAGGERAGMRLIGRDDDVIRVVELCAQRRLVTLLGTGGIGKTRLAANVARRMTAEHGLHSEVVELAPVRDERSVVAAIATQLQVQPQQGRSVTESLLDLLGDRPLLLVLDNCEHVLETVAGFTERLLHSCRRVHVLTTSREPLGLPDETVFVVPRLPVAPPGSDFEANTSSPAVALFVERARAANPDFVADASAVEAIAELCRRLDGVPLAIELAAARTRSLSPTEIIERLGDRFALLTGSSRVSDERHRSLKDLVDWSYDLLDVPSRQLFSRLSIFAGAFDLAAVEQVCGYGAIPRARVATLLSQLVDKSMVQSEPGRRTRYRVLETLREYGAALPEAAGSELAERHGAWILQTCERGAAGVHGVDERQWLDTFDALFDDLRLAVRNALRRDDLATALGIVVAAREHAFRRLRYELIGWAESALAHPASATEPLAAAAWGIVAYGRFVRGEIDAAIDIGERALDLASRTGMDALGLADRALGNAYVFRGDLHRFAEALDRLIHSAVSSGDPSRIAHAYYMRSLSETRTGGPDAGMTFARKAQEAATRANNATAGAQAAYATGVWMSATDRDGARAQLDRSESLARDAGNLWFVLFARTETLWLAAHEGEPQRALREFADVIAAWHRAGDWANQWLSLRRVLGICHLLGVDELAATIHGALERAGAVDAYPFEPGAATKMADTVSDLRRRLGEQRFAAAHQRGQQGSTSAVIDLIVEDLAES